MLGGVFWNTVYVGKHRPTCYWQQADVVSWIFSLMALDITKINRTINMLMNRCK